MSFETIGYSLKFVLKHIKVTLQDCIIIIGKRRASENPEVWNPKTYGYHKKKNMQAPYTTKVTLQRSRLLLNSVSLRPTALKCWPRDQESVSCMNWYKRAFLFSSTASQYLEHSHRYSCQAYVHTLISWFLRDMLEIATFNTGIMRICVPCVQPEYKFLLVYP